MNYYKQHQELLERVMLAFQKRFPYSVIFERHVGLFYTKNGAKIKINKKGMADLWAIVNGRLIEIEIKTGNARQTKHQKKWQAIVESNGAEYYLIRNVAQVDDIPL